MNACRYKSGDVGHIHHKVSTYLIGDLTELFKINGTAVSAGSRDDQLWFCLKGNAAHFIIINKALVIYPIRNTVKNLA